MKKEQDENIYELQTGLIDREERITELEHDRYGIANNTEGIQSNDFAIVQFNLNRTVFK
jgi:hypothetical protein